MAQKQKAARVPGSHLDDKFRQNVAKITGRGRRTLFTAASKSNTGSLGVETEVYRETIAARLFKSQGDAIHLTFGGVYATTIADGAVITLKILDEDGVALTTTAFTIDPGVLQLDGFFAQALISLGTLTGGGSPSLNVIGGAIFQDFNTPMYADMIVAQSGALTAKKLTFQFLIDAPGETDIYYILAEFIPAAIT